MTTDSASSVPAVDAEEQPGQPIDQRLADRVAVLEAAHSSSARPWYRQPSLLISMGALAFSMGATLAGEQRSTERDRAADRVELSLLIQRLVSLPKENA
jgi:hypothetical protein